MDEEKQCPCVVFLFSGFFEADFPISGHLTLRPFLGRLWANEATADGQPRETRLKPAAVDFKAHSGDSVTSCPWRLQRRRGSVFLEPKN